MAQPHGHSVDEYLETIYFLAFPIGEYRPATGSTAIASRVAEMLGVSRVGRRDAQAPRGRRPRRARRAEGGDPHRGAERAKRVVRKHRIIERFLTDFMGYTAAESHVHADELGDTFTDEMIERINERLGRPDRCPHGWPVEPEFEQAENASSCPRGARPVGRDAEIVRLAEHDGDLLHWFYDEGLVPARRSRCSAQPAAGQLMVAVDGAERAITERAADGIYVRAPRSAAVPPRPPSSSRSFSRCSHGRANGLCRSPRFVS